MPVHLDHMGADWLVQSKQLAAEPMLRAWLMQGQTPHVGRKRKKDVGKADALVGFGLRSLGILLVFWLPQ
jgi:hypothetical protein